MQALSRTSIGWGWSVMVHLNAVVRGGRGHCRKQRMYVRVCALCARACTCVTV